MNKTLTRRIDELIERILVICASGKSGQFEIETIRHEIFLLVKDSILNADRFLKVNSIVENSLLSGSLKTPSSMFSDGIEAYAFIDSIGPISSKVTTKIIWPALGIGEFSLKQPAVHELINGSFVQAVDGIDISDPKFDPRKGPAH